MKQSKTKVLIMSLILLFTMSFHGFFEGMALGVTQSSSGNWNIFLAILLHKWAEAMTLTLNCLNKGLPFYPSLICLIGFSVATPMGILFGYLIDSFSPVVL